MRTITELHRRKRLAIYRKILKELMKEDCLDIFICHFLEAREPYGYGKIFKNYNRNEDRGEYHIKTLLPELWYNRSKSYSRERKNEIDCFVNNEERIWAILFCIEMTK